MTRERAPLLDVGYVARPHGVRGELRVVTHDPASTTLFEVERVAIGGQWFEITQARPVKGAVLVRLSGLVDRDQVEALRGQPVSVDRAEVPVEDGEVFLADLVGCEAVLPDGSAYGTIAAVETGAQDRLVIHHGDVERLLPLVPAFVAEVDLERGRVVVTPPEGLPESPRR